MATHASDYGACQAPHELPEAMDVFTYAKILGRLSELRPSGSFVRLSKEEEYDMGQYNPSYVYRAASRCCGWLLNCIGDEGKRDGYTEAEMKLRLDMTCGKCAWYGEYWRDLWCWTRNSNPLLALFYSHRLHPVSRAERTFISLLQAVLVMMISSATPRAEYCMQIDTGSCATMHITGIAEQNTLCCFCQKIGLTWCLRTMPHGGGIIYALVVNIIFAQILYGTAGCGCCQDRLPEARRCWELLGHVIMFTVFIVMIIPTVKWVDYNAQNGMLASTLIHFVVNKPLSMLGTTAVQTLVFSLKWRAQVKEDEEKDDRRFFVTAPDYIAWINMKAGRGRGPHNG